MPDGRSRIKRLSTLLMALFFIAAGANHFLNPAFYLPLIPDYIPFHSGVNGLSGVAEIGLGMGLFSARTRKLSSTGIILLLVAFIPSHVYFIQVGGCIEGGLCTPLWVAWLRLVVVHPLLILWAWSAR